MKKLSKSVVSSQWSVSSADVCGLETTDCRLLTVDSLTK
jgi:hypothetical protein